MCAESHFMAHRIAQVLRVDHMHIMNIGHERYSTSKRCCRIWNFTHVSYQSQRPGGPGHEDFVSSDVQEDAFLAIPILCRISSIRHQRVSDDWNR